MPAVPDLLERIRKRPEMYLGECSLSALYHTLGGYALALGAHGIENDTALRLPHDFHDWIAYRLHYKESTSGWKNMILSACPDETTAFHRFFELLDHYRARKPKILATVSGLQKTYRSGPEGRERTQRYPTHISLIAYTDDPGFFVRSDEPGCALPAGDGFFPSLDWFETFTGIHLAQLTVVDAETFNRWRRDAEPDASPNGGPAEPSVGSSTSGGPQSVS